jgi:hypothetical protein
MISLTVCSHDDENDNGQGPVKPDNKDDNGSDDINEDGDNVKEQELP